MLELNKELDLPSEIIVEGKSYSIKTDYQFFINFSLMLQESHTYNDYDVMYVDSIPDNKIEGFRELNKFAYPEKELPRKIGDETDEIILDFEEDEEYIYSAFWQCYGIDLKKPGLHLHWYKFKSLLNGIVGTKLNKIMDFRSYVPSEKESKSYKEYMLKNKAAWRIEKTYTKEEQDAIDRFNALLK